MSNVHFIGCLHLGHEKMARFRGFSNAQEMSETFRKNWNNKVRKKDLVYILGDVTMEKPNCYPQLDWLNGRKIVIMGNHDLPRDTKKLLDYVDSVAGFVEWKNYALTHAPIHPDEMGRYQGNIHAHIHHLNKLETYTPRIKYDEVKERQSTEGKYICCDAHLLGYTPLSYLELNDSRWT